MPRSSHQTDWSLVPEKLHPLVSHGVNFTQKSSRQWIGDCPFSGCEKEGRFHADPNTGMWDCKVCGCFGNAITFLDKVVEQNASAMRPKDWRRLSSVWELPPRYLKLHPFGKSGSDYTLGSRGPKGHYNNVHRFDVSGGPLFGTKGCESIPFNMAGLTVKELSGDVWVCEGQKDAVALSGWLRQFKGRRNDVVVGVPGAGTFKDSWASYFKGRTVRFCYDNDAPGRAGQEKAAAKLQRFARSVQVIEWPEKFRDKADVRDFVAWGLENKADPRKAFAAFKSYFTEPVAVVITGPSRFTPIDAADLENRPPKDPQLAPFFSKKDLVVLYGPSGCGKSFVVLWMAGQLHGGLNFLGGEVSQGGALIVMGEGSGGMPQRLRALRSGSGIDTAGMQFVNAAPDMRNKADVDDLIREITIRNPDLVVLDTLARTMPGGDENSSKDMGEYIAAADRIRNEIGATVVIVHHTGKAGGAERGSSALRGSADVMVKVSGGNGVVALACDKSKDSEPFDDVRLELVPIDTCDGGTSCHLVPTVGIQTKSKKEIEADKNRMAIRYELKRSPSGLGYAGLVAATELGKTTVKKYVQELVSVGIVKKIATGRSVTFKLKPTGGV